MNDQPSYSAPALEKGLDILELLAVEGTALTTRQVGERLGRSKNEIFRMVHVLIQRGYIARAPDGEGLTLTNRLFALGMQTARMRDLIAVAGPVIERLADEIRQSVHLVVANRGETVVIGAASGGSEMTFSLKLGYRRPLVDAHSGLLLMAYQVPEVRQRMIEESIAVCQSEIDRAALENELNLLRREGSIINESRDIIGVTDIAAPIVLGNEEAIACIIVAYLNRKKTTPDYDFARGKLVDACSEIARRMEEFRPPLHAAQSPTEN
ncbi:IclR family transcriptional regulator [Psychromarinibacter sp. C21-152]|uniref:IclR family transcriptional regulator n=1 Tax=Psychromarinibacter sediminicola TaxID=3033385 RepID=A0AAE3NWA7_9RHOB|nr:IclR family transcriptional regulator [Psychromarinibacter sediminicola]MDF0603312.1 IclR family transcriptional regulator [Psychromarinibacter sediminicola]